ncbi:hypothetical protein EDD85DRAFT_794009 [Armillaria nabsnona]|nr:hypothetical protein EDD85DRAFT_794009 [Armillaria nabsnona]
MKSDSWLWGVLKPEGLAESAEDEWITEKVELLEEERWRVEVLHRKMAETWTQIAEASDIKTGAAAYAYKVANVHTKLAAHCVMEWEKAVKKVVENHEEDCCTREREDELAHKEEEKIHQEDEDTMCSNPDNGEAHQLDMDKTQKVDEDTLSNGGKAGAGTTSMLEAEGQVVVMVTRKGEEGLD